MKRETKLLVLILMLGLVWVPGCTMRRDAVPAAAAGQPAQAAPAGDALPEGAGAYAAPEEPPASAPAPTPEPTPTPTPEPTPEPTPSRPDVDVTSWQLILANADHPIGDYAPELTMIENGQQFDVRAADALRDFIAATRAQGLSVCLSSAYRGYYEQEYLYNRKVGQYGEEVAKTIVLPPGTSEHQTGLSADITDIYYSVKNSSLENTAMFQWMNAHCEEYGFILRYPSDKEDITKVMYEPWHFRYVGVEAATYMKENNLCLEEFLALYSDVPGAGSGGLAELGGV